MLLTSQSHHFENSRQSSLRYLLKEVIIVVDLHILIQCTKRLYTALCSSSKEPLTSIGILNTDVCCWVSPQLSSVHSSKSK